MPYQADKFTLIFIAYIIKHDVIVKMGNQNGFKVWKSVGNTLPLNM